MSDVTPAPFPTGTILGYPRIGANRELKKALESFWKGASTEADLEATAARAARRHARPPRRPGPRRRHERHPHATSRSTTTCSTPPSRSARSRRRFADLRGNDGSVDLAAYSTIARGVGDKAPLEMTKWFDSNYHYLVPEIGPETVFALSSTRWVDEFLEAKAAGFVTRPVITGPLTFLYLAKASDEAQGGLRAHQPPRRPASRVRRAPGRVQGRRRRVGADRRADPGGRHRRRPRRGPRQRRARLRSGSASRPPARSSSSPPPWARSTTPFRSSPARPSRRSASTWSAATSPWAST